MSSIDLPPHLDPRGRHRGGTRTGTRALRPVGRLVGSLVSIGLLVLAGVAYYQYRAIDKGVTRLNVQFNQPAASGSSQSAAPDIDGKDQNILIVGNDDRSNMTDKETHELKVGRDGGSLATDTMMIVHVPADGSKATLISLPRDTQADIPDGYRSPNRLNSPYASAYTSALNDGKTKDEARVAGADLLIKTITNLTGLHMDHYVQIDLLGFYRLSVALGGVPVTLCHDVDDRHSTNVKNGSDGGSGLHLSAGRHVLSGVDALAFVRQRHNLPGGDFDRVKRQQYFLTAAFRQVSSVGVVTKIKQLGDALQKSVYFDSGLNLFDLATQLNSLAANNIIGKTIPENKETGEVNPEKVKKFVADVIAGTDDKSASAKPSTSSAPKTTAPSTGGSTPAPASSSRAAIDSKCIN